MKLFLLKILAALVLSASPSLCALTEWMSPDLAKALPIDSALAPVYPGIHEKIRGTMPRTSVRPGENTLEVVLEQMGEHVRNAVWRVEIVPVGGGEPVSSTEAAALGERALMRFDARSAGPGLVRAQLIVDGVVMDVLEMGFSVLPETPYSDMGPQKMLLDSPSGQSAPGWVTFGFPMPAGACRNPDGLRLRDSEGNILPAQFLPVAQWFERGSVKWLRVDAVLSNGGPVAVVHDPAQAVPGADLQIRKDGEVVEVSTGAADYRIERGGALLNRITTSGKPVAAFSPESRGLYVVDQKGRLGRVSPKDTVIEIELEGPKAAMIRVSGIHRAEDGEELGRFTAWFEFAAGRPECRITHHFVLTRDSNAVWFREAGWDFDLEGWQAGEALFAAPRGEAGAGEPVGLDGQTALVAQIHHRRYGGDADRIASRIGEMVLERDGEMGDWAAGVGIDRALLIGCSETARQHPKAFHVSPGRIGIDLFHSGGGEELDFRVETLLKRWNAGGKLKPELVEATGKQRTNAVGWSKTHFLVLSPIVSEEPGAAASAFGSAFARPVFASADPQWVYETRVAGPLYPRDRNRFPEAENFIDSGFEYWNSEQDFLGEYGYVDFFAGPHHTRDFPQGQGRFRASYTLRNAFWLLYLRSGERKFREMAQGTNRTYLDSYLASWDGPERIKGLYIHSVGTDDPFASLPFYWEGFTRPGFGTHTNLNQFLFDYYLTGNPRAKAGVLEYAEGLKRWWASNRTDWRILAVLRAANQAYGLTWDPALRLIQEEILNEVYAPASPIYQTADGRPYRSSTYKTQEDLSALIEGWELHGTARYFNLADATSRYWWNSLKPGDRFERGRSGAFLWASGGDASIAMRLWNAVREESALAPEGNSAQAVFRFQGIPYALSVVERTNADRELLTSWAGAEIITGRGGFVVRKDPGKRLEADLLFPHAAGFLPAPAQFPIGTVSQIGLRLMTLESGFQEASRLCIPAETEPATLFFRAAEGQSNMVFLNESAPLVLYAEGWWKPVPASMSPAASIFFKVPDSNTSAFIHFERSAILHSPVGATRNEGQVVSGKVEIPPGSAGLWSFSPVEEGAVRLAGIPPVFSFDSASPLFDVDPSSLPPAPVKVEIDLSGTLSLKRGSTLVIEDGGLPFQEGTLEFFYKPAWDSFSVPDGTRRRLFSTQTENGHPGWSLRYVNDSKRAGWPGHPWSKVRVLEMEIPTVGPSRPRALCVRGTLVTEREWMHIAVVWGKREFGHSGARTEPAFDVKIFVNGTEGRFATWPRKGNSLAAKPVSFTFGPDLDGEIAMLRLSGMRRYEADFDIPKAGDLRVDESTLALYPFSGGLEGVGGPDVPAPPPAILKTK